MATKTVMELVKGRYADATVGIVDEVSKLVPEIKFFDSRLIKGTQFKTLARTSLPTTGFRKLNEGIAASRNGYDMKTFDLGILAGLVQMDKAEALGDSMRTKEQVLADEANGVMVSAFKTLGSKVWYGDSANAEAFAGAATLVKDSMVVDAGGSTANACSSVFAVGNGATDGCGLVLSEESGFLLNGDLEFKEGKMLGKNNLEVPCFWTDLTGWAGFSCVNANRLARLANLDATKTLTDALLADLVGKYEEANDGLRPDALFVSFAQRRALQKARSAIYPAIRGTKGELTAPTPVDFEGIPLIATNAIVNTEAVWAEEESSSSSSSSSSSQG